MFRMAYSWLLLLMLTSGVSAQESLKEEQLKLIKSACVFVKVGGSSRGSTGSGFLVKIVDGKTGYIVTNHHVIDLSKGTGSEEELRRTPIQVIFNSGTDNEKTIRATVVASDHERDLAVLRVTSTESLPKPLDISEPPKLRETMPVFVCGFPFGGQLSEGKKNPEISIGPASISSIRSEVTGGPISRIQLNGALNPGNSGGPVVASDGKLIGVAVATIRGSGLGLAIPHHEVSTMMRGRPGDVTLALTNPDDTKGKLDVTVIDPLKTIKSIHVHILPGGTPTPKPTSPPMPLAGAQRVEMKIDDWHATADVMIPGETKKGLLVQLELELEAGKTFTNSLVVVPQTGRPGMRDTPSGMGYERTPEGNLKLPNGSILPIPQRPFAIPEEAAGTSISELNADPDNFVGKSVKVLALTSCSVNFADRGEFELSVETSSQNAPTQVRVTLPKDLALQIAGLGIPELTRGTFFIKFPIQLEGTVSKPSGRERRYTLLATQIDFLSLEGKPVSTFKSELAPKGDKPTLDDVNRFPEKYVGKTLVVDGYVVGTRSADGVGLEIANQNYAPLLNLDVYTSKGLAAQVDSDLPKSSEDRVGRAKITLEVKAIHGRTNKGVVGVKQLEVEIEDAAMPKVLKASTDVVYPKIPAPIKLNPTPEAKPVEKTETAKTEITKSEAPPKPEANNAMLILMAVGAVAGLLGGGIILFFALRQPKEESREKVMEEAKPTKRGYQRKPEAEVDAPKPAAKTPARTAKKPPPPADDNPFSNFG